MDRMLRALIEDAAVTDVLINGDGTIWVDRGARLERAQHSLPDPDAVRRLAVRLAAAADRRLDDSLPYADGQLPGGLRLHAVLAPIASDGAHVCLRVARRRPFTLTDLQAAGSITAADASHLRSLVASRRTILVTGGTGSGNPTNCQSPALGRGRVALGSQAVSASKSRVRGCMLAGWQGLALGDQLAVVGILVTVVGFSLTIWQLVRTANASEASRKAIEATARRMSMNHLLVLLPQLRMIESDLDAAAAEDDRKLAIRSLVNYSHTATQVATLLEAEGDIDDQLIERLRSSAKAAGSAKSTLVTTNRAVRVVIKEAVEQIGEVSSHATGLVGKFQVKVS